MSVYTITPINRESIPDLLEVEGKCFAEEYAFIDEEFADIIGEPTSIGFLLFADNKVIGYILGMQDPEESDDPQVFYLSSLAVLPEYRGRKLARRLMDTFMDEVSENGYTQVLLHTKDNPDTIKAFQRLGFKELLYHPTYYEDFVTDTSAQAARVMMLEMPITKEIMKDAPTGNRTPTEALARPHCTIQPSARS